jgi:hypothetical protein
MLPVFFWTPPVLEYLHAILGTTLCLLLLIKTFRLQDAFWLVFNDTDFFRNPITLFKQILNLNLPYWVNYYYYYYITIIIIAIINVHSKQNRSVNRFQATCLIFLCFIGMLCVYCITVLYLFCASFVIGHCAVKLAH